MLKATQPDSTASKLDLVTISGPQISADINGWAVNKNNPTLAKEISKHVTDMWREGAIEEHYKTYFKAAPFDIFLNPPEGAAMYVIGPWEDGVTPPASQTFPEVKTLSDGELTVGVAGNTPMLTLEGEQLTGPEGEVLKYAADNLGLTLKGVMVDDPASALRDGTVDVLAGAVPATEETSHQYWQSMRLFQPRLHIRETGRGRWISSLHEMGRYRGCGRENRCSKGESSHS